MQHLPPPVLPAVSKCPQERVLGIGQHWELLSPCLPGHLGTIWSVLCTLKRRAECLPPCEGYPGTHYCQCKESVPLALLWFGPTSQGGGRCLVLRPECLHAGQGLAKASVGQAWAMTAFEGEAGLGGGLSCRSQGSLRRAETGGFYRVGHAG